MTDRLGPLRGRRFDILVVGGGIHGAAIARDAAGRGLAVALVEARDFCAGTTSRSTRLVHGGLRYLAHGALGLVRESGRERSRLLRLAPGMVEPLEFLLPVFDGDSRPLWQVRAGLALYRLVGGGAAPMAIDPAEARAAAAGLRAEGLRGAGLYRDARCLPERLVLAHLLDAERLGAVAVNYAEVRRLEVRGGRVRAAIVQDLLGVGEAVVEARAVVNAAGPWAEEVVTRAGFERPRLLRPVRGAHAVVSGLPLARAVAAEAPDGRLVFAVPWGPLTVLGTTEAEHPGDPSEAVATPAEVAYLLEAARRIFPGADPAVVHTYAGVRNLVAASGPARSVSREARLVRHAGAAGLVTLVGGKLTTHRPLAERVVDLLAADLAARGPAWTAEAPLPAPSFDPRLDPASPALEAAARRAAEAEKAVRLADVVFRRTWAAFHPACDRAALERAARAAGAVLGWDAARRAAEVAAVEAEAARLYGRSFTPATR